MACSSQGQGTFPFKGWVTMFLAPIQPRGEGHVCPVLYGLLEGTQRYTYVALSFSSPEVSSAPCLAQACVITKYLMEAALKKEKSPRWLVSLGGVFTSYQVCHPHSNCQDSNSGVLSLWRIYYPFQYDLIRQLNWLHLVVSIRVGDELMRS